MFEDIFNYNKSKKSEIILENEPTDLVELSNEAIEIVKASSQTQLPINFNYSDQILDPVLIDRKRLTQVLVNLLNNAVKFTPDGAIELKLSKIQENLHEITFEFAVTDTGIGISSEHLNKIFQDFYQVNKNSGTGLGLSISQQIIKTMGSQIRVKSQLKKGSSFYFKLNLKKSQKNLLSMPIDQIKGYLGKKKKILLAEDRLETRELIKSMLIPLGFEIIEASSGKEGIEKAIQLTDLDLILTDYFMGDRCGLMMAFKLRLIEQYANIPIILTSSSTDTSIISKNLQEQKINDFLPKPIEPEKLLYLLQKHLDIKWTSQSDNKVLFLKNKLLESQITSFQVNNQN